MSTASRNLKRLHSSVQSDLLLNLFQNDCCAYSLRKLRLNYTGAAIRVRRSSDNSEKDIGFSGVDLDVSDLETFVGSGDGFVKTIFDQSVNARDLSQATNLKQAKIATSGIVNTLNNRPVLIFDGINDNYIRGVSAGELSSNTMSAFVVVQSDDDAIEGRVFQMDRNGEYFFILREDFTADEIELFSNNIAISTPYTYGVHNQITSISLKGVLNGTELFIDGSTEGTSTSNWGSTLIENTMSIGSDRKGTGFFAKMRFQELVVFDDDKNTDRISIEGNQNLYWL